MVTRRPPPGEPAPRALDRQNRIVLPPEVIDALSLKEGDHVGFRIEGKKVVMHRAKWVLDE